MSGKLEWTHQDVVKKLSSQCHYRTQGTSRPSGGCVRTSEKREVAETATGWLTVKVSVMRKVASTSPCDLVQEPRTECVAEVHASRTWHDTTLMPEDRIGDIACVNEVTRRHSSDPADAECQDGDTSPFNEGRAPAGRDRDLQKSESAYDGANREAFNEKVGTACLPVYSNAADANVGVAGKVKHLRGLERDNRRLKNGVMMLRLEVELLRQIVQHASCSPAGDKVYLCILCSCHSAYEARMPFTCYRYASFDWCSNAISGDSEADADVSTCPPSPSSPPPLCQ